VGVGIQGVEPLLRRNQKGQNVNLFHMRVLPFLWKIVPILYTYTVFLSFFLYETQFTKTELIKSSKQMLHFSFIGGSKNKPAWQMTIKQNKNIERRGESRQDELFEAIMKVQI